MERWEKRESMMVALEDGDLEAFKEKYVSGYEKRVIDRAVELNDVEIVRFLLEEARIDIRLVKMKKNTREEIREIVSRKYKERI